MNKLNLVLFILIGFFIIDKGYSQETFRNGFIITLENDTIYGLINAEKGYKKNSKECVFKKNTDSKKIRYTPLEINAYRILGDKFYVSKLIAEGEDSINIFLEFLVDGTTNLYYYRDDNTQDRYFIEKEGEYFVELKDTEQELFIEGKSYIKDSKEYLRTLNYAFKDCPDINNEITQSYLDHNSLIKLTSNYHKYTCGDEGCVIYQKEPRKAKFSYGIYSGIQYSFFRLYNIRGESNAITMPIGLFLNSTLPAANERFSIQLELNYSRYSNVEGIFSSSDTNHVIAEGVSFHAKKHVTDSLIFNTNLIRIPIFIKYTIHRKIISPNIRFGFINRLNFNSELNRSVTIKDDEEVSNYTIDNSYPEFYGIGFIIGTGIEYKIGNLNLFTDLQLQVEYNKLLYEVQKDTYISSFNLGTSFTTISSALYFGIKF